MSVQIDLESLAAQLERAREAYYNDEPIMPDDEFDALVDRARELGLDVDSVVGAPVAEAAKPHPIPMLSLLKVTDNAGVEKFFADQGNSETIIQPKLDGVSLSLEYQQGKLIRAVTRGDGVRGEDITHIVKHLDTVPVEFEGSDFTGVVRGEAVIHRADLASKFKNTRNAVSGLLNYKTKSPADAAHLGVRFYAFDMYCEGLTNCVDSIQALRNAGFSVVPSIGSGHAKNALLGIEHFLAARGTDELPYDIDGVVLKVSDFATRDKLGNRSNSPRWAIAFKPASETAVTRLNGVTWQVGTNGTITPVAELEPVDLCGVTISRASLHNPLQIKKLGISIGDEVVVKRANDVIPQVCGVAVHGESIPIVTPIGCPECFSPVEHFGNSNQIRCGNPECAAQAVGRLTKWASRDAADIDAVSGTWIEQFIAAGLLRGPADFYNLSKDSLITFNNMGEKRADKFLEAIELSKQCGMRRVLIGLAIPDCGEGTAKRLCKHYESVEQVAAASVAELAMIEDIGIVVASSIHAYFQHHDTLCDSLRAVGVNLDRLAEDAPLQVSKDAVFAGKKVVVTGTLTVGRDDFHKLLEQHGAIIAKSVSSKTDVLVIGKNVGANKTNAARKHGVTVVDEEAARRSMGLL